MQTGFIFKIIADCGIVAAKMGRICLTLKINECLGQHTFTFYAYIYIATNEHELTMHFFQIINLPFKKLNV